MGRALGSESGHLLSDRKKWPEDRMQLSSNQWSSQLVKIWKEKEEDQEQRSLG